MTTQSEFFLEHAVNGELTDAQMLQMMNLPEGDTSAMLESGTPDAAANADDSEQKAANETKTSDDATPPEPEEEKPPVVLARDGVHTIPYDTLVAAREGEKHWKAQAEAAQRQLADLQAQAQARADSGQAPTKADEAVAAAQVAIDNGVDPAVFGDFSEEALAKGIQIVAKQMVAQEVQAKVDAALNEALAPIRQKQQTDAVSAHLNAIYSKHPDADSIAESKELADWIAAQPSFARAGYQAVLTHGSTADVIEFFDTFKEATGKTGQQTASAQPDVAAAAQAALAKAKAPMPNSLSEIPAGSKAHHDETEALMEMSDSNALTSFLGKSPEQIRALLDRAL